MLELQNINKFYNNSGLQDRRLILDQISLKIEISDSIAITGPSGSGKSTLLNILGTLDSPTSGIVLINNININTLNDSEISKIRNSYIGFIFQKHYLLPQLNVLENILIPVIPLNDKLKYKSAVSKGLDLLEKVGLAEKKQRLPSQLSVGECQRVAVVRALINDPKIVLADEPTGSLDNDSAYKMGDLLMSINKTYSIALVIVTHSLAIANIMKTKYKLLNGRLIDEPWIKKVLFAW